MDLGFYANCGGDLDCVRNNLQHEWNFFEKQYLALYSLLDDTFVVFHKRLNCKYILLITNKQQAFFQGSCETAPGMLRAQVLNIYYLYNYMPYARPYSLDRETHFIQDVHF